MEHLDFLRVRSLVELEAPTGSEHAKCFRRFEETEASSCFTSLRDIQFPRDTSDVDMDFETQVGSFSLTCTVLVILHS